jgi:hydroxysqualene dehydroxylase
LAGLSAALRLSERGVPVTLYEMAGQPGGRCRSFFDRELGRRIDNGNHLILSGNRSTWRYLETIGGLDAIAVAESACFPFLDLVTGARWSVRPNAGPVPWRLLLPSHRIPGTALCEYFSLLRLARARPQSTVAEVLDQRSELYERFWEPLTLAVLNAVPEKASAHLLWKALRETFGRGERHCRPMIARSGLSDAFVEPAIRFVERHGARLLLRQRLKALRIQAGCVDGVAVGDEEIPIGAGERIVLALPPSRLRPLLPALPLPKDNSVILNAHFRVSSSLSAPGKPEFLGLLKSKGHWVFARQDVVSVTISAADGLGLDDAAERPLLAELWREVRVAFDLPDEPPLGARLIRERRATFDQSPAGVALRPKAEIGLRNLVLAGDFTDTGLPATIEGAIRSGERAAELTLAGI